MKTKKIRARFFNIPLILPYLKKYTKTIVIMVTLGILTSIIDSVYPIFHKYALNHFIGEKNLDTIKIFFLSYFLILAFQTLINFISTYFCARIEMLMDKDLRNAAFYHLQNLSFSYFNQNNVGYIHARVMSDTGKIGEAVSWRFMDFIWSMSYIVSIIIVMFFMNIRLSFVIVLLIPIVILFIVFFQKKLIVINRKIREINSKITGNFNENITGIKAIKTLVIENKRQNEFEKDTKDMNKTSVKSAHYSAMFASLITFMGFAVLSVVLWMGGYMTAQNIMEIGTLSVFMSYALSMMDPIQNMVNTITSFISIEVNIERFDKLMKTESDVKDSKEVIEKYGDTFNPKKENWEEIEGDIEFENVSFKYPDGEEYVLEDFNLKVGKGDVIAIVGETGAGKSTLVNLACRFYEPTKGRILIDGKDARDRSKLWLHSAIGYVLQSPHLFSGTIRDNLKYGKEDASDEEIMEALSLVSAKEIVQKMEKGLDSEVGEGGDMLSVGQKQLLSFARALLANPRILVLDEATSSIDSETEKAIQNAIKVVTKGRTTFMIAHRLSTVVDSDIIFAVKSGKIIEKGTHKELMEKKGYYYELYTKQFRELETMNNL